MPKNFKDMAKNSEKARENENEYYGTMINHMLPDYEKHCMS